MPTREPLDPAFPLAEQFGLDGGPVRLVNLFSMPFDDEAEFLTAWRVVAIAMKAQPGFISVQLMRAIGPCPTFLGESIWETIASVRAAFSSADILEAFTAYPEAMVVKPHLFATIAVPDVCIA